jgi:hypothetical protein
MKPYENKITINPNAKPNHVAKVFFGVSIGLALLAVPVPFFRHVLTFSSIILAIICVLGAMAAKEDLDKGPKRVRPATWGTANIPIWFKIGFFLFMIAITAGLRLGFYVVPVAWVLIWAAIYSILNYIEKSFIEDKKVEWPTFEDCTSDEGGA